MPNGAYFYFRIKRGGSNLLSSVIHFYDQLLTEMEEQPNINLDSDDSDDIPDIFESSAKETIDDSKISPGDIVWAEFRNLHWPALVRRVLKKESKIIVWYLDSPGKCFKLSRKRILSFKNSEICATIRKKASESPMNEIHDDIVSTALTFLRRRSEGCNDNPAEYFDFSIPYLSFKNFKAVPKGDSNVICNSKSLSLESNETDSDCTDDEIVSDSDIDECNLSRVFSEIQSDSDDIPCDKEKVNSIISCIKAGQTDKHLVAVQAGKVPSEFQKFYEDYVQFDRKELWLHNKASEVCGIIKDPNKLMEISTHLMDLYERTVKRGKCEVRHYVVSVWLPESIKKAICILDEELKSLNESSSPASSSTKNNVNENSGHCEAIESTSSLLDEGNDIVPKPKISKAKKHALRQKSKLSASKRKRNIKLSDAELLSESKKKANISKIEGTNNPNNNSFTKKGLKTTAPKTKKPKTVKPLVKGTRSSPRLKS